MIDGRSHTSRRAASLTEYLGWIVAGVLLLVVGFILGRGTTNVSSDQESSPPRQSESTLPADAEGEAAASSVQRTSIEQDATESDDQASPSEADAEVPVMFDPPELDFDLVQPDEEMRGTVVIRNVGPEPLTIQKMVASCKCTTAEDLSGTVIPPGGTTQFTAVMEAPSYSGTKKEQIRFLFAGYGVRNYSLRAMVSRAVRAEPPYLTVEDRYSGTYVVESLDDRPFRILATNGEPPVYAGSYDPDTDEPRSRYELVWDLTRYDPRSCVDDAGNPMPMWWVVETDHPQAPIVDMRIRHVPCTLIERPQPGRFWVLSELRVVVGTLQPGESYEFAVSMKWLQERKPTDEIGRVESRSDRLDAELLDVTREGDEITAHVRVTASEDHRGLIYDDIRFYGDLFPTHSCGLKIIGRVVEDDVQRSAAR